MINLKVNPNLRAGTIGYKLTDGRTGYLFKEIHCQKDIEALGSRVLVAFLSPIVEITIAPHDLCIYNSGLWSGVATIWFLCERAKLTVARVVRRLLNFFGV